MALFTVSSIYSNYDRPLDYHISEINNNCTLYWYYSPTGLGLALPGNWRIESFCLLFAVLKFL